FATDAATSEISTLSLHDALPILAMLNLLVSMIVPELVLRQVSAQLQVQVDHAAWYVGGIGVLMVITSVRRHHLFAWLGIAALAADRKSTRLNSSHVKISYAVFCL